MSWTILSRSFLKLAFVGLIPGLHLMSLSSSGGKVVSFSAIVGGKTPTALELAASKKLGQSRVLFWEIIQMSTTSLGSSRPKRAVSLLAKIFCQESTWLKNWVEIGLFSLLPVSLTRSILSLSAISRE